MQPTNPLDVAVPVESVLLQHLKTLTGEGVVVGCEAIDEVIIADRLKALPGGRPPAPVGTAPATTVENMKLFEEFGPPLIEAGTFFVDAEGKQVRPAFYFDESKPRHTLSLPGRVLRMEDRVTIVESILRLSGYMGVAAGGSFHGRKRARNVGRVGTRGRGSANGADAVGGDS